MAGAAVVVTVVTAGTLVTEVLVVLAVPEVRVAAAPPLVLVGTEVDVEVVCGTPFEVVRLSSSSCCYSSLMSLGTQGTPNPVTSL